MTKKEEKALKNEVRNEVHARYNCTCDLEENRCEKLHNKIIKVFEKNDVPVEVALATLKNMMLGIYTMEVTEEMGVEL